MAGCGPYSPTATLAPDALRRRVLAVERLLSERERGRAAAALSQAQALGRVTNPKLAALVTDLYYEAGECEAYLARVDAATQGERLRLADAAPRTATCRARVDSDDERADTPPASDLAPVADPSPEPTIAASSSTSSGYVVAGWVTLAGGVALLGTGGAFWGLSSAASGDADEAAETWNDPAASSAARAAAWSERQRLSDDATQHQVTAWIMGGLGAAALVTGVILLVTAPGDDEAPVAPTVGLTSVGLRGRF